MITSEHPSTFPQNDNSIIDDLLEMDLDPDSLVVVNASSLSIPSIPNFPGNPLTYDGNIGTMVEEGGGRWRIDFADLASSSLPPASTHIGERAAIREERAS